MDDEQPPRPQHGIELRHLLLEPLERIDVLETGESRGLHRVGRTLENRHAEDRIIGSALPDRVARRVDEGGSTVDWSRAADGEAPRVDLRACNPRRREI